jgi:hypothetical protein
MLQFDSADRDSLWLRLIERVERYAATVETLPVSPELSLERIRSELARFDFEEPIAAIDAVDFAADALTRWQVHTPHPRYFGLFNPALPTRWSRHSIPSWRPGATARLQWKPNGTW